MYNSKIIAKIRTFLAMTLSFMERTPKLICVAVLKLHSKLSKIEFNDQTNSNSHVQRSISRGVSRKEYINRFLSSQKVLFPLWGPIDWPIANRQLYQLSASTYLQPTFSTYVQPSLPKCFKLAKQAESSNPRLIERWYRYVCLGSLAEIGGFISEWCYMVYDSMQNCKVWKMRYYKFINS